MADTEYRKNTNLTIYLLQQNLDIEWKLHSQKLEYLREDLDRDNETELLNVGSSPQIPKKIAENSMAKLLTKLNGLRYNIEKKNWLGKKHTLKNKYCTLNTLTDFGGI